MNKFRLTVGTISVNNVAESLEGLIRFARPVHWQPGPRGSSMFAQELAGARRYFHLEYIGEGEATFLW